MALIVGSDYQLQGQKISLYFLHDLCDSDRIKDLRQYLFFPEGDYFAGFLLFSLLLKFQNFGVYGAIGLPFTGFTVSITTIINIGKSQLSENFVVLFRVIHILTELLHLLIEGKFFLRRSDGDDLFLALKWIWFLGFHLFPLKPKPLPYPAKVIVGCTFLPIPFFTILI